MTARKNILHAIIPASRRACGHTATTMPLMMFYGEECPHCERMKPLIEKLEKEEGLVVEKYETWHDAKNAEKLSQYDKGDCGGVPFFVNTDTDAKICGATDYDKVKAWAGK